MTDAFSVTLNCIVTFQTIFIQSSTIMIMALLVFFVTFEGLEIVTKFDRRLSTSIRIQ